MKSTGYTKFHIQTARRDIAVFARTVCICIAPLIGVCVRKEQTLMACLSIETEPEKTVTEP
jgi:hypothetical protein